MLPYPPEYSTGRVLPQSGEALPAATELEVVDGVELPLPVAPGEDARGQRRTPFRESTGGANVLLSFSGTCAPVPLDR